jgi:ABC-type multidrug transport system ATPase subunit
MEIIDLITVGKAFGKHVVLKQINYKFKKGFCYLLTGENGSGKSTLIKNILKLNRVTIGEIVMNSKRIGYVPEKISFPEFVKVAPFLQRLALIKGIDEKNCSEIIEGYLHQWGLIEAKYQFIKNLSKGMVQKVLIIQALLNNPEILIFDEPLNGLDEEAQKQFMDLVYEQKRFSKTIIISTHYPKNYDQVADIQIQIVNKSIYEKSISPSF